jgi:hypothetical protein
MLKKYFWNLLIAIDQLFNTILFGDPDETISSRLGKWLDLPKDTWRYKVANVVCRLLRKLDDKHCRKSVEKDEGDRNLL